MARDGGSLSTSEFSSPCSLTSLLEGPALTHIGQPSISGRNAHTPRSSSSQGSSPLDCDSLLDSGESSSLDIQSLLGNTTTTSSSGSEEQEHGSEVDSDLYLPPERPVVRHNTLDGSIIPVAAVTLPLSGYELYQLNPMIWHQALLELTSLKAGNWMSGNLIDIWLLDLWHTRYHQTSFRYLPTDFIQAARLAPHPDPEINKEIKRFREFFLDLPQSEHEECPLENFLFILNVNSVHYFVVVFTPALRRIHVLGQDWTRDRRMHRAQNWELWGGPRIVKRVCELYGWPEDELEGMTVNTVDWVATNDYDCGPLACQIIEHIWLRGLDVDESGLWRRPKEQCCHGQRLTMATRIFTLTFEGYRAYQKSKDIHRMQMESYLGSFANFDAQEKELQRISQEDPDGTIKEVDQDLRLAILSCRGCTDMMLEDRTSSPVDSVVLGPTSADNQRRGRKSRHLLKGTRCKDSYTQDFEDEGPHSTPSDQPRGESGTRIQDLPSRADDWTEAKIGRYPRPKTGPLLPTLTSLRGLRHSFSSTYDDYTDGPSLDVLDPIPDTVMKLSQVSLAYIANKVITAPWMRYEKDFGYRLLPDFLQSFLLTKPILVREHLSPVGLEHPPGPFMANEQLRTSRSGRPLVCPDRTVYGAKELMSLCDKMKSDLPLLKGKDKKNRFIYLDLERDSVVPQILHKSCDIDSLIWITRMLRFAGSVSFYALPLIRKRPPIWKNNHIMVDLLYPQSEDDQLSIGSRTEWQTKRFGLSQIPHLLLGQLDGTPIEIIVFFPRMTHQHPHTHRWQNAIPLYVQNFFWDNVFLPAVKTVLKEMTKSYVVLDRDHAALKGAKIMAHNFDPNEVTELIQSMEEIIKKEPKKLAKFGSFFFVTQVKGSKRHSQAAASNSRSSLYNAVARFRSSFPGLNWPYMMDRINGELFVDVGITIQPEHEFPLVGFWRLDCLEASFGAAGFLSGEIHTINTMALYGGLQAESPERRRQQTHVVFRSAYSLPYEATRQRDNSRDFFKATDVYRRNKVFSKQLENIHTIYGTKAKLNSYGVRDEYRVGGAALEEMMETIDEMVETFLESTPIVWLPSSTWFEFLDRRLGVLSSTHGELYKTRPKNYGVLSGLFSHLMQSVIFTPPVVDTYVRETLAALRYQSHVDSDGAFFLHTLDLERYPCIEGIRTKDDRAVLSILGGQLPERPAIVVRRPEEERQEEEVFPLGQRPSWSEITKSLKTDPYQLMPKWSFPSVLRDYMSPTQEIKEMAANLFIKLTQALWITVHPGWVSRESEGSEDTAVTVHPTTLEEALETWSVDFVCNTVEGYQFRPCNSGFRNLVGKRMLKFSERRLIYFPDKDESEETGLPALWQVFMDKKILEKTTGYLGLYHQYARKLGTEKTWELHQCLEELLTHCQCLPDSNRRGRLGQMWTVDQRHLILLANPSMYRIKGVGSAKSGVGGEGTRGMGAQRGLQDISLHILMQNGIEEAVGKKAISMKKRATAAEEKLKLKKRSGKSKNARPPPQSRRKTQAVKLDGSGNASGGEMSNSPNQIPLPVSESASESPSPSHRPSPVAMPIKKPAARTAVSATKHSAGSQSDESKRSATKERNRGQVVNYGRKHRLTGNEDDEDVGSGHEEEMGYGDENQDGSQNDGGVLDEHCYEEFWSSEGREERTSDGGYGDDEYGYGGSWR